MDSVKIFKEADNAYEKGDFKKAFKLFRQLADGDNPDAMSRVALMFFDGEGVEKDIEKSIEWDKKAIDAGSLVSYSNLAITYRFMGDIRQSKFYFEKAIETGDLDAALELAKLYMVSELEKPKIIELLKLVSTSNFACDDSIQQANKFLSEYLSEETDVSE